jgi:hypothetical protein
MARGKATTPLQIVRAPTVLKVNVVRCTTIDSLRQAACQNANNSSRRAPPHPKSLPMQGLRKNSGAAAGRGKTSARKPSQPFVLFRYN